MKTHSLTACTTKIAKAIGLSSAALLLGWAATAPAAVTLTDIGTTAPTPGTYDISQLVNGGGVPGGLNYYWDDGANNPGTGYPSQTFTTGSNPQGYILTSVALQTGGGGGGTPTQTQSFTLLIFEMNGSGSGTGLTNATLVGSYTATSALAAEGDWMEWTGLGTALQPGTNYGFSFGRSSGTPGDWEELATATSLPYAGGQSCLIANAGGKIKYSSVPNNFDMTFDLGLALPAAPIPAQPGESPASASIAAPAGQTVTLTASAGGSTPITYQWQTDGGTGGAETNISGATSTNLVVNTTGWAPGTYSYDFVASNSIGSAVSSVVSIHIVPVFMEDIGTTVPTPGPVDIAQLTHGAQQDDGFNYYTDDGAGHGAWAGQTFTTGTNLSGYVMNSLAWLSAGNGNSFPTVQLYDLYIYTVIGTTATQVASYQAYGGGTENDWLKWIGLSIALAPNTQYAYAFGRDATAGGWEHIADESGNPYPGGQLCTIPTPTGGTITYGNTGGSDAVFDLGLVVSSMPFATLPTYTPNVTPVYAGTSLTLNEAAVGPPPLSYEWLADNGTGTLTIVGGAASSNLVVDTTGFAPGTYQYAAIVTNSSGVSTSSVLSLTVVAASIPTIVTDIAPTPANEGYVGQTVTFSATFTGTLPITYQWYLNTGSGAQPISAASNPTAVSNTLTLSNLQAAQAGTYYVTAQNSVGGPVSSSSSTLTVLADLAPPAAGTYGATVLAASPVAYWRLNETEDPSTGILPAYDASGNNFDGVYGAFTQNGFNGIVGPESPAFPGFEAVNNAVATGAAATNDWVTVPPVDLFTNTVTITMWINPSAGEAGFDGLFMNRNNSDAAGLGFGGSISNGMAELGYTWNTNNSSTWGFNSGLYPPLNQWSLVALVVQPNSATIYLFYIDPVTSQPDLYSAVNPIPHGPEQFSGGTTQIGSDPAGVTRAFVGSVDEVAVYNTAMTSGQILQLFSKAAGLTTVLPSIAGQPQSQAAYQGETVAFNATGVNGTAPITYQWQFVNTNNLTNNLTGATNASLILPNVTSASDGTYRVLVMNPVGTTTSSNATLTVVVPVPGSYESAVLADGPLAFWKLNETNADPATGTAVAFDYVGGYDGVYGVGAQDGYSTYNILGPEFPPFVGFPAINTAMETFYNVANSYVTASIGPLATNTVTYTMWIDPETNVANWAGLVMSRAGSGGDGFGFGGDLNATGMSDLAYTWNGNNSDTWSFSSYLFPPTNEWSFVALVIAPDAATIYMINSSGIQSAVNPIAHSSDQFAESMHIGNDAQDGGNGGRTFAGSISSASLFLSSLTTSQLVNLYNAGAFVTLTAKQGTGTITLTWSQGQLLQSTSPAGPWTTNTAATSPYTTNTSGTQMFFKVSVP